MHVDQRQVTIIDLQDGRGRDVVVVKDGWGYKLSFVSREDVVDVLLSAQDLQKLFHVSAGCEANGADQDRSEKQEATPAAAAPCAWQGSALDWICFN